MVNQNDINSAIMSLFYRSGTSYTEIGIYFSTHRNIVKNMIRKRRWATQTEEAEYQGKKTMMQLMGY